MNYFFHFQQTRFHVIAVAACPLMSEEFKTVLVLTGLKNVPQTRLVSYLSVFTKEVQVNVSELFRIFSTYLNTLLFSLVYFKHWK